jgi:rubrerythrin
MTRTLRRTTDGSRDAGTEPETGTGMETNAETSAETERETGPDVTGPYAGYDRYGRFDHYYWRCEACGTETTDASIREGCPRCADRGT